MCQYGSITRIPSLVNFQYSSIYNYSSITSSLVFLIILRWYEYCDKDSFIPIVVILITIPLKLGKNTCPTVK